MAKEKTEKKVEKKPKNNKKVALIILIVAVVMSIGAIVLTKLILWPWYQERQTEGKKEKVEEIATKKRGIGMIYEMDAITVNTYQSSGRRFANIKVSLETHSKEVMEELEKRDPQIMSIMINYYRSKTVLELTQPTFTDSSAAILIDKINEILTSGKVTNLFYQDLLIQ